MEGYTATLKALRQQGYAQRPEPQRKVRRRHRAKEKLLYLEVKFHHNADKNRRMQFHLRNLQPKYSNIWSFKNYLVVLQNQAKNFVLLICADGWL
jgi:hypothetical protein